ncbi:hypothetical protein NEOLEDRAFT_1134454 [Neolentinus lepideus HHB14362 ss-1]|uniref:HMG box domain-containing protein n=1 Tax=Neolentinus lepideus HHB14362 ss-1 TaxID=1314782 RepID=A0A165S8G1_9AGAM|nr:hypothetical protein NEOLEDRAFT_1134454 [Neolentinus lepideus HHB14362 ss-1]
MAAQRPCDTQSRSFEVTTDTPQSPTAAILSPTPQAIPFPTCTDAPYSPSSSPFAPHARRPTLSCTPSPPPLDRTMSPTSPSSSISSTASFPTTPRTTYRRRKSTSETERRPKKGDEDYIKRPENAFILFRRKCVEERQAETTSAAAAAAAEGASIPKKQRQAELSKLISHQWKSLSAEDRLYWEDLAKQRKKEHEQMYPDYVYRPQRTRDRKKKQQLKTRRPTGTVEESVEVDAQPEAEQTTPTPATPLSTGRSQSAPAPPPALPSHSSIDATSAVPQTETNVDPYGQNSQGLAWPPSIYLDTSYNPDLMFNPGPLGDLTFAMSLPTNDPSFQNGASFNSMTICTDPSLLMASQDLHSPASSCASHLISPLEESFSLDAMTAAFPIPNDTYYPIVSGSQPYVYDGSKPDFAMQALQYQPCWQDSSLWSTNEMLFQSDFDVSNVPSVELGLPKISEDSNGFASSYASPDRQAQFTGFSQPHELHRPSAVASPFARIYDDYHDNTGHY